MEDEETKTYALLYRFVEKVDENVKKMGWVGLSTEETVTIGVAVLHAFLEYLKENEPYAVNTISAVEIVLEHLPQD